MKKLFIITGEHSGDLHASAVVEELQQNGASIEIEAIGGEALKAKGVKLFCDHSKMSVMGLNFKAIKDHLLLEKDLTNYLKEEYKPDFVLLIDYGGFNLRMAKALQNSGAKIFYYICPQLWATRKHRIKKIKKYVDKALLILPFEKEIYDEQGIDAKYVGNPLVSQLPRPYDKQQFIKENNLDENKKIIGVFPGSRKMEIDTLLPTFLKAVELISQKTQDIQFCIAQAPTIKDELLNKYLKNAQVPVKVLKDKNHQLLSCSDSLILASGTVALEAALYETPMLVSYRGPWLIYWIYRLIRCIEYVSLPNIIMNKPIIEELIQKKSKPDLIANVAYDLIFDNGKRDSMIEELAKVKEKIGDNVASKEVASVIISEL